MESASACLTCLKLSASPSARRIAICLSASAFKIADCFSPSATKIADCFAPSARSIFSLFSRSARICFSIASRISFGGRIFLTSTRLTLIPQGSVASSRIFLIFSLMISLEVKHSSRASSPIMFLNVVALK